MKTEKRIDNIVRWENLRIVLQHELDYLEGMLGERVFPKGKPAILELGSGELEHASILQGYGYHVTTSDIKRDNRYDMPELDIRDLRFLPDKFFDVVMAHHVLEHVPLEDTKAALKGCHRIMQNKDALLFVNLPCRFYWFEFLLRIPKLGKLHKRWLPWRKPNLKKEHCWEISKGFPPERFAEILGECGFVVLDVFRDAYDILFIATKG